jgi:hypothetical protein
MACCRQGSCPAEIQVLSRPFVDWGATQQRYSYYHSLPKIGEPSNRYTGTIEAYRRLVSRKTEVWALSRPSVGWGAAQQRSEVQTLLRPAADWSCCPAEMQVLSRPSGTRDPTNRDTGAIEAFRRLTEEPTNRDTGAIRAFGRLGSRPTEIQAPSGPSVDWVAAQQRYRRYRGLP